MHRCAQFALCIDPSGPRAWDPTPLKALGGQYPSPGNETRHSLARGIQLECFGDHWQPPEARCKAVSVYWVPVARAKLEEVRGVASGCGSLSLSHCSGTGSLRLNLASG